MTSPQAGLDRIQSNTLDCMNIAADVMDMLQTESHDAPSLKAKCEQFLNKILDSQVCGDTIPARQSAIHPQESCWHVW